MAAAALTGWMDQPWTQAWLSFNLMPARWLHPARRASLLPEAVHGLVTAGVAGGDRRPWDRHLSGVLLGEPGMDPVGHLSDPALPLALLDDETFGRLALWSGLVVVGHAVRQTIAREEVARLTTALGEDGLRFARHRAPSLWQAAEARAGVGAHDVAGTARRLGLAMLSLAVAEGAPPLAARALLRLPPEAGQAADELPADFTHGPAALRLARQVLEAIDPEWLSSFPTPR